MKYMTNNSLPGDFSDIELPNNVVGSPLTRRRSIGSLPDNNHNANGLNGRKKKKDFSVADFPRFAPEIIKRARAAAAAAAKK